MEVQNSWIKAASAHITWSILYLLLPDGLKNVDEVPLTEAIQQNNLTLVEELVKRKANPCAMDPNGETPLHEAMRLANRDGGCLMKAFRSF